VQSISTDGGSAFGTPAVVVSGGPRLEPLAVSTTEFAGLIVLEPRVFEDTRGFFMETFHSDRFAAAGLPTVFVQDNHSFSRKNVIRGLHYQIERPQGKLVRAVRGSVFDVAVDLRRRSPTFGHWWSTVLSEENRRQVYVPSGFAHGFCALTDLAEVIYKCTDVYHPRGERTIVWDDPHLAIPWPADEPILAEKDRRGLRFCNAPYYD
jgi:dTDP-4-dehydrorhamnose 3,5-epimerase